MWSAYLTVCQQTPQNRAMTSTARTSRGGIRRLALALAVSLVTAAMFAVAPTPPAHAASKVTFTQVSAGYDRALALSADGAVYAWGSRFIGDGTTKRRPTPTRVHTPVGVKFTAVSAGLNVLVALASTGDVYAWGSNLYGAIGIGKKDRKDYRKPVKVKRPAGVKFTAISAGADSVLALASNGAVYAWGANDAGQLGDGSTKLRRAPVKVKLPAKAVRISSTDSGASYAIAEDGTAYAWGANFESELGNRKRDDIWADSLPANPKPITMIPPAGVRYTQVGRGSFLATGSDGATYAWGRNDSGNLGNGTIDASCGSRCVTPRHLEPVEVSAPAGVTFTQLESSTDNRYAIGSDGNAYAWGYGALGQVGDGSKTTRSKPVKVKTPSGVRFRQVSAATHYALAVGSDGRIYAWGANVEGTFGDGSKASWKPRTTPAPVKAPSPTKLTAAPTPKITGTKKAGKTLKAKPGSWKPSGIKRTYQWYRGSAKIEGATKSSYRLTSQDKDKKITVKVTGRAPGFATKTKTSAAARIR